MERFGEKLRTLRQQHNLTVRELAAKLEVNSHSHIVQIEVGKSNPSINLLLQTLLSWMPYFHLGEVLT